MATVRKRILKTCTRWVVDYRDSEGKRHWITCRTREDAERIRAERTMDPGTNPRITFRQLVDRWLSVCEATVSLQTLRTYRRNVERHMMPELGPRPILRVSRGILQDLLAKKLASGLSPKTVSSLQAQLHGIFEVGIEHGIIKSNPARRLGKKLNLKREVVRDFEIKAFEPSQLDALLVATREIYPHLEALFYVMSRTGMRISEAAALRWENIDFDGVSLSGARVYRIHVKWKRVNGRIELPKGGRTRYVIMSSGVRSALVRHRQWLNEHRLKFGWRELPPWVFVRPNGEWISLGSLPYQFKACLKRAGLAKQFHLHCLRHTFASWHIRHGTPIGWIKEQLGHRFIQTTYDVYGKWLVSSDTRPAEAMDGALDASIQRRLEEF